MTVPGWLWVATIGGFLLLVALDIFVVSRNPRDPSIRESTAWTAFYVSLAALFGVGVFVFAGGEYGGEFIAGYITEYSLSVDNLFVFLLIMTKFAVPSQHQNKILLIGIALSMVLRGVFIAAGAATISAFNWVFYIFGALLLYTAVKLALESDDDEGGFHESRIVRGMQRVLPTTDTYDGSKLTTKVNGRRMFTPMIVVVLAIGVANVIFALDSLPAIFGLTHEAFIVFTTNAFALLGLRQIYFLIGHLLKRLVYLSYGLSVILGFIGLKLVLEALEHDGAAWAPHISILVSLMVIVVTLLVTTAASLVKSRRDMRREDGGSAVANAQVD